MIQNESVVSATTIDHICLMIVGMMLLYNSIWLSYRYMIVSIAITNTSTTTVNACIGYMTVVTAIESFLAIDSVIVTKHTAIYTKDHSKTIH
jgi:hypothetical protein